MCSVRHFGISDPVTEVLDKTYSQLTPLSEVAVQARQSTRARTVSILCSLAGRFGYRLS
jgi:hypothetical protein